jgi:hypothetical protein
MTEKTEKNHYLVDLDNTVIDTNLMVRTFKSNISYFLEGRFSPEQFEEQYTLWKQTHDYFGIFEFKSQIAKHFNDYSLGNDIEKCYLEALKQLGNSIFYEGDLEKLIALMKNTDENGSIVSIFTNGDEFTQFTKISRTDLIKFLRGQKESYRRQLINKQNKIQWLPAIFARNPDYHFIIFDDLLPVLEKAKDKAASTNVELTTVWITRDEEKATQALEKTDFRPDHRFSSFNESVQALIQ